MLKRLSLTLVISLTCLLGGCSAFQSGGQRHAFPPDIRYPLGEDRQDVHAWIYALKKEGFWGDLPQAYLLERTQGAFFDWELWCFPERDERFLTLRFKQGKLISYDLTHQRPQWVQ